jgi:ketosteroid isomerase-like protein
MRTLLLMVTLLVSAPLLADDAGREAADREAFGKIEAQWLEYYRKGDVDGLMSLYADDAWVMPRGKPAYKGKAEIRGYFAGIMGSSVVEMWSELEELELHGDVAHLVGLFRIVGRTRDGRDFTDGGRYLIIYKRGSDGQWRVYRDIDTRTPDSDRLGIR